MEIESIIRFTKKDANRLAGAIRQFNNKISRLEREGVNVKLPEKLNYQTVKSDIFSRRELNKIINSLKRFQKENAIDNVNGMTRWEKNEFSYERKNAILRLQNQIKKYSKIPETVEGSIPTMGDTTIQVMKDELKAIKKNDKATKAELNRRKKRIKELAKSDSGIRKASNYRKQYIKAIEKNYKNFEGSELLIKKLKSIRNPKSFYNKIKNKINESDIYYLYYATVTQDFFNDLLEAWDVKIETETEMEE